MSRIVSRMIFILCSTIYFQQVNSFHLINSLHRFKSSSSSNVNNLTAQQPQQQQQQPQQHPQHHRQPLKIHHSLPYLHQKQSNTKLSDQLKGDAPAPVPEKIIDGAIDVKSFSKYIIPVVLVGIVAVFTIAGQHIDVSQFLSSTVKKIEELGPYGYVYFALVYILAELVAIPVFPLTASSGYLFGLLPGTLLVVGSATTAAAISFFIGRTFLKSWAQQFIQKYEIWRLADKAIAKEGFKFVLLLRLSPILPFAVANYLYAVTSVDFWSFIFATFLGFLPGSFGFVYFGNAGKEIFASDHQGMPWYGYAAIGGLVLVLARTLTSVAMNAVNEIKKEEEKEEREALENERKK